MQKWSTFSTLPYPYIFILPHLQIYKVISKYFMIFVCIVLLLIWCAFLYLNYIFAVGSIQIVVQMFLCMYQNLNYVAFGLYSARVSSVFVFFGPSVVRFSEDHSKTCKYGSLIYVFFFCDFIFVFRFYSLYFVYLCCVVSTD